ncbi:MAG: hypothetical protein A4E26_00990 [Methanobacterium sp. PtaU1.Bin097]|nr:MAG: hypothetical protein A4E26_00990 [Methanobacterium sp. PtaU1.Bin097]
MAPNSLIARAQHIMDPTTTFLRDKGKVIIKKVLRDPEPNVRATFSIRGSTFSNPSREEFTTKEELAKSMATIIPGMASEKVSPIWDKGCPKMPPGLKTNKRIIPLTVWGITKGTSITDSTKPFPQKSLRARR